MTQQAYPFWETDPLNPFGDKMSERMWGKAMRYVLNTGIISVNFDDGINQLYVYPGNTLQLQVDTGAAWIMGYYYDSDTIVTLSVDANTDSSARYDLIVVELKLGLKATATLKVIKGIPGQSIPTPQQKFGVIWQLPIANVKVTQGLARAFYASDDTVHTPEITDMRTFVNAGNPFPATYMVAAAGCSPLSRGNAHKTVPYGATDADSVINEGIQEVSDQGGGTLILSDGNFPISGQILPLTKVNIAGQGNQTTLTMGANMDSTSVLFGSGANQQTYACKSAFLVNDQNDVQISGLSIMGNGGVLSESVVPYPVVWFDGVTIKNGTSCSVRNCTVKQTRGAGVSVVTDNSSVTDNYGFNVSENVIVDCILGIWLEGNGGLYTNNQIRHCGQGIELYSDDTTGGWGASLNTISSNSVIQALGQAIVSQSTGSTGNNSQNLIGHNIINNWGWLSSPWGRANTACAILLVGARSMYNHIVGNRMWGGATNAKYGIWLDGSAHHNSVTGNACDDTASTNFVSTTNIDDATYPNYFQVNYGSKNAQISSHGGT
jgi:hypothetical protein